MSRVVSVRKRRMGKVYKYKCGGLSLDIGNIVILQADRGDDYGEVVAAAEEIDDAQLDRTPHEIKRKATDEDIKAIKGNRTKAKECIKICNKKIDEFKLAMKLVSVEYSFDRSQLVIYFTAEGRVDFRALVKELASIFRIRIELRQIGVRDEAKMLGGYGVCGRPLCCASFLKDFTPVTVRMAKEQRLPLNPSKISGVCGRLMCCLIYEHEIYKELVKTIPREGTHINLPEGKCRVVDSNVLKQIVYVQFEDGRKAEVPCSKIPGKAIAIKKKWENLKHVIERDDLELKKLEGQ